MFIDTLYSFSFSILPMDPFENAEHEDGGDIEADTVDVNKLKLPTVKLADAPIAVKKGDEDEDEMLKR